MTDKREDEGDDDVWVGEMSVREDKFGWGGAKDTWYKERFQMKKRMNPLPRRTKETAV